MMMYIDGHRLWNALCNQRAKHRRVCVGQCFKIFAIDILTGKSPLYCIFNRGIHFSGATLTFPLFSFHSFLITTHC